jgi:hypothetical protein
MQTFILRSDMIVFPGILILTLFVSTIWISSIQVSMVHAIPDQTHLATIKPISVKITDPIKGQQIGVGKNLTLLGTSKYNATSNCQVLVIVDSTRPYQKTIPIGQAGADDYSKWRYALAPTYAGSIKEGINRITAKLLCNTNPTTLTKFYSINVTGVNETLPKQQPLAIRSNNTVAPFFLPVSSSFQSAPLNNTNAPPILPVSVNSSALITPLSAPSISSSSASSGSSGSNGDHHSNHGTSSSGDTHTTKSDHHSSHSGGGGNNHHHHKNNGVGGGGSNLIRGIISHFRGF